MKTAREPLGTTCAQQAETTIKALNRSEETLLGLQRSLKARNTTLAQGVQTMSYQMVRLAALLGQVTCAALVLEGYKYCHRVRLHAGGAALHSQGDIAAAAAAVVPASFLTQLQHTVSGPSLTVKMCTNFGYH